MKKVMCVISAIAGIVLIILGITFNRKGSAAISVVGGADGPTSIFLAGRLGDGFIFLTIFIGIILLFACAGILYIRKKRQLQADVTDGVQENKK